MSGDTTRNFCRVTHRQHHSIANLLHSFRPEKTMSTARIIPAPRVATTSWIVIALLGAAIIAYAVYGALDGNIASSDLLVGP
jgi:hypothetical protein